MKSKILSVVLSNLLLAMVLVNSVAVKATECQGVDILTESITRDYIVQGGTHWFGMQASQLASFTITLKATQKPEAYANFSCDGTYPTDFPTMLQGDIDYIDEQGHRIVDFLQPVAGEENTYCFQMSAELVQGLSEYGIGATDMVYFKFVLPNLACDNAIEIESGYSTVLDAGEYWFSSNTYYLPLRLTIYPEVLGEEPDVYLELTCDGNYKDSTVLQFVDMINQYGSSLGMSFPLHMNNSFQKDITDSQGKVIGYMYECPSVIRDVLMLAGADEFAPAFVHVICKARSRILVETGLESGCRDDVSEVRMGARIPVRERESEVYLFPIGKFLNQTYTIHWEGAGESYLYIADNCLPGREEGQYVKQYALHEGDATITPEITRDWIGGLDIFGGGGTQQSYGTELYLKCFATEPGYVVFEEVPKDAITEYHIVEAIIGDVPALITITEGEQPTISVTLPKSTTGIGKIAKEQSTYLVSPRDGHQTTVEWTQYVHTVSITGSDVSYTIDIDVASRTGSTDASIAALQIDGVAYASFSSYLAKQTIRVSSAPTSVTATMHNANASYTATQNATAETGDIATWTITCTAEAGNTQIYTLHFVQLPSENANLSVLSYTQKTSGYEYITLQDGVYEYSVQHLEYIPQVDAVIAGDSPDATVEILQATRLPGYAQVIVTAPAGNQNIYTIFFKPEPKEEVLHAYGEVSVLPVPAGAGKVFAAENEGATPDWSDAFNLSLQAEARSNQMQPVSAEASFYLWAGNETQGYIFEGWNNAEENTLTYLSAEQTAVPFSGAIRSTTQANATQLPTYYAHFRHPEPVRGATFIAETDGSGNASGKISFVVKDTKDVNELILVKPAADKDAPLTFGTPELRDTVYTVPFTYSGTGSQTAALTLQSKDAIDPIEKTCTITVNYTDGSFGVISASAVVGQNRVVLSWEAYNNAARYQIRRDGQVLPAPVGLNYTDDNLTAGIECNYRIVAYDNADAIIAVKDITVTPGRISPDKADNYLIEFPHYASFEKNTQEPTYTSRSMTDMSHLFANGKPLMDSLFVLVDNEKPQSAQCYVYGKVENDYKVMRTFNPRMQSISYTEGEANGKKLYFLGSCTAAFTGLADETEGFFYAVGGEGEQIDIYLDSCTLIAAPKTAITQNCSLFDALSGCVDEWFRGGASVFAFRSEGTSENNAYSANIHIRRHNELKGNLGCKFVLAGEHPLSSSPVAIRPTNTYHTTTVAFDDKWPDGTATNGWLGMRAQMNTPSIDLGNEHGKTTFNGGQYRLWGSYKTKTSETTYSTTLAIAYRHFTLFTVSVYGFGSDQSNGLGAHIYDGTFTSYTAAEGSTAADGASKGVYRTALDIRLPQNSTINGGTFNEDAAVYCVSDIAQRGAMPLNAAKESLCRVDFNAEALGFNPNENGTVTLISQDLVNYNPFGAGKTGPNNQTSYGATSINVGENGHVYLYVVSDKMEEVEGVTACDLTLYQNWHVVLPKVQGKGTFNVPQAKKGGDIQVLKDKKVKNAYLAYFELDRWSMNNATISITGLVDDIQLEYQNNEDTLSKITNDAAYSFEHGMYMVLPLISNEWYQFVPPFDVNKMYIVEHRNLETQRGAGKTYPYTTEGTTAFLNAQGKANFDMAYEIYNQMAPTSGVSSANDLITLLNSVKNTQPDILELTPYTGENSAQAHFYLYEATNNGTWETTRPDGGYGDHWQFVAPTAAKTYERMTATSTEPFTAPVLLQTPRMDESMEFHVYTMCFPSSSTKKYWDGKYLILEGYGPQNLRGSGEQDYFFRKLDDIESGYMQLLGNYTFSKCTVTSDGHGVLMYDKEEGGQYVKKASADILPGRSFIGVNTADYASIAKITRQGVVVWETQPENPTNLTLPTLAGDVSMLAYGQNGTLVVESNAAQNIYVYTASGNLIYTAKMNEGQTVTLPLEVGMYLVSNGTTTHKIIIEK